MTNAVQRFEFHLPMSSEQLCSIVVGRSHHSHKPYRTMSHLSSSSLHHPLPHRHTHPPSKSNRMVTVYRGWDPKRPVEEEVGAVEGVVVMTAEVATVVTTDQAPLHPSSHQDSRSPTAKVLPFEDKMRRVCTQMATWLTRSASKKTVHNNNVHMPLTTNEYVSLAPLGGLAVVYWLRDKYMYNRANNSWYSSTSVQLKVLLIGSPIWIFLGWTLGLQTNRVQIPGAFLTTIGQHIVGH